MLIIIALFLISGIGLITLSIAQTKSYALSLSKIAPAQTKRETKFNILKPLVNSSRVIVDKFGLDKTIRPRLELARVRLSAYEFITVKFVLAVIFFIAVFGLGSINFLKVVVALLFGYLLPDLWLMYKIRQRKLKIVKLMPESIDLLGLCIEAGLDFMNAVKWVIEKSKTQPFLEELALVAEEIKWGKSRSEALKDMAKRLGIPEISSFVRTLVQADRLGTPVSEAFTILSEDTRMQRYRQGERMALKAPIKILIPLIFCILPVIGIIVGGPIFIEFFMGGGLLKFGG